MSLDDDLRAFERELGADAVGAKVLRYLSLLQRAGRIGGNVPPPMPQDSPFVEKRTIAPRGGDCVMFYMPRWETEQYVDAGKLLGLTVIVSPGADVQDSTVRLAVGPYTYTDRIPLSLCTRTHADLDAGSAPAFVFPDGARFVVQAQNTVAIDMTNGSQKPLPVAVVLHWRRVSQPRLMRDPFARTPVPIPAVYHSTHSAQVLYRSDA